ncbi:hypothetical protein DOTSEDRAFT_74457 [Dothistroma septosporum NZE10]|uniref:Uncharacterized protein n=1 Tax=Dothistroma septosporum (strain NZE10 / CBS 128990) TaxID=675120 RepID=N1PHV3_DOTSN|nr:hypothetical protein DOTSEDRAFT_74457 [Dothistroma septosporum NZE10]
MACVVARAWADKDEVYVKKICPTSESNWTSSAAQQTLAKWIRRAARLQTRMKTSSTRATGTQMLIDLVARKEVVREPSTACHLSCVGAIHGSSSAGDTDV